MTRNAFAITVEAAQTAAAAGITDQTLQNWLKRDVIVGHKRREGTIGGGGSKGRRRQFTFFNVMEIATAAALLRVGVSDLGLAFEAACGFSHFGEGELPGRPKRNPSLPFDAAGYTMLVLAGEKSDVVLHTPGQDLLSVIRSTFRNTEGFVILDMSDLFDRVCASLGLHPEEVLRQSYGSDDE